MSLFFEGERKRKVVPITDPDGLPADWEAALDCVSRRFELHVVASHGHITIEQAQELVRKCRKVDPLLLDAIQKGTVTTQASATTFIKDNTDGFFPAAKFVAQMKIHVGTADAPATWAQVVDAAKAEEVG